MRIENKMIIANEGKFIHRIGDSAYYKSAYLLPNDTLANFEEVDTIPEPTEIELPAPKEESEYNKRVNAYIRAEYTESEEMALTRQKDSNPEKKAEWERFNAFCEECKLKAKEVN